MARAHKKIQSIYLDHASTTPMLPEVFSTMKPYFTNDFYNPSALYKEGIAVKKVLDMARKDVATAIRALSDEIVFTGSGTEADNVAIMGVVKAALRDGVKDPHIIISSIEHPAIMELQDEIKKIGGRVSVVPVLSNGVIDMDAFRKCLKKNTVLVSIMYANNEIGTIQPIREIAKAIRFHRKQLRTWESGSQARLGSRLPSSYPFFHTDASQAANYLDLNILSLGVDMLTLDGSKIYGPKGVGMLFVKRGTRVEPIVFGGGQEGGLRSGTENVAGIAGFAKALSIVGADREKESKRLTKLRDTTIAKMEKLVPDMIVNGKDADRLPNIINVCVPHMDGEYAVILSDAAGIALSSASSCQTLTEESRSYVIESLGTSKGLECAGSSLRFSLGRGTTQADMNAVLKVLPKIITTARIPLA